MTNDSTVVIKLAGGGDEPVRASGLSYIRRVLDFEAAQEPEASSVVVVGGLKLASTTSPRDLASKFAEIVEIISLSAPDNSILQVRGAAVKDVDDTPSTMPGANSWLVFGVGPSAPRLGVRQTREQLRDAWLAANLDPEASGI